MWSDDIDKKIQDAAGNHEPPFQEEDWNRMHALLEKHLPQEKKKRPLLLGMLFFLVAGFPATVMLTTYKSLPPAPPAAQTAVNSSIIETTDTVHSAPVKQTAGSNIAVRESPVATQGDSGTTTDQITTNSTVSSDGSNKRVTTIYTTNLPKQKSKTPKTRTVGGSDKPQDKPATEGKALVSEPVSDNIPEAQAPVNANNAGELPVIPSTGTLADSSNQVVKTGKDSVAAEEPPTRKEKKSGNNNRGKWQISFSTGPDLSMVGVEKTGKWKMQYGVGVSYAFSERFQLRSGFMVSRKLYYADSSDYHPPKGFWNYYTNLEKIDANCLVYEIPLNIVYTFPSTKKHQWFVSTGLSSYLMKKETYEYYFKDNWGVPMYRERTIQNENDHFFSILQLSGGYQYKFSERLSLTAEPYAKLPLGGVGFGKVKLNNTGILFSLGFKPFVKNKPAAR